MNNIFIHSGRINLEPDIFLEPSFGHLSQLMGFAVCINVIYICGAISSPVEMYDRIWLKNVAFHIASLSPCRQICLCSSWRTTYEVRLIESKSMSTFATGCNRIK